MSNAPPDLPPIKEYKSSQREFNEEQTREFASLADAMRVTAALLQLMGLAFVVLATLTIVQVVNAGNANRWKLLSTPPASAVNDTSIRNGNVIRNKSAVSLNFSCCWR